MLNGASINNFLTGTVLAIILIVGAIMAATKWKAGGIREAASIVAVSLIACFLVAMATHPTEVGNWLYGLVTGK